jgi:hypothetical protein
LQLDVAFKEILIYKSCVDFAGFPKERYFSKERDWESLIKYSLRRLQVL